jgi:large subunit ribosomal protein L7Ae
MRDMTATQKGGISMTGFVKYQTPKEVSEKVIEAVTVAKTTGKIIKGVNETTKAIERGICKFVVMAEDVQPPEILMHIPVICDEKKVAYGYVASKLDLGKASGIGVPTSSIAIVEEGDAKKTLAGIRTKIEEIRKG